jgi:hypothetical protein
VSGTIGSRNKIFTKNSVLKKLLREFFPLPLVSKAVDHIFGLKIWSTGGGLGKFLDIRYLQQKRLLSNHKNGTMVTFTESFNTSSLLCNNACLLSNNAYCTEDLELVVTLPF